MNTSNNTKSGGGVSVHYDRKVVYRRRRMPYRKKRYWKKFAKKVKYILDKNLATKTIVRNDRIGIGKNEEAGASSQAYNCVHLYGSNGSIYGSIPEPGLKDVQDIVANDTDIDDYNEKSRFTSAILDLTMKNDSEAGVVLEVDVYDIVYYRDNVGTSFRGDQINAEGTTPNINVTKDPLYLETRGATLFEFPTHLRRGLKILKKTKFFLGENAVATYQIRDSKNRTINSLMTTGNGPKYAIKGLTRTVLFIVKPAPLHDNGAGYLYKWNLLVGSTRTYKYVVPQNNQGKDNYL